jgi:hypothetical protein
VPLLPLVFERVYDRVMFEGVGGAQLAAAVAALDPRGLSAEDALDYALAAAKVAGWATAAEAAGLARMHATYPAGGLGDAGVDHRLDADRLATTEVRAAYGCSQAAAGSRLGFADALDALPRLADALACGLLGVDAVRVLVRESEPLAADRAASRAAVDAVLDAHRADLDSGGSGLTVRQVTLRIRRAVLAADPDRAERQTERARKQRRVWHQPDTAHAEGVFAVAGPVEGTTDCEAAVDALARAWRAAGAGGGAGSTCGAGDDGRGAIRGFARLHRGRPDRRSVHARAEFSARFCGSPGIRCSLGSAGARPRRIPAALPAGSCGRRSRRPSGPGRQPRRRPPPRRPRPPGGRRRPGGRPPPRRPRPPGGPSEKESASWVCHRPLRRRRAGVIRGVGGAGDGAVVHPARPGRRARGDRRGGGGAGVGGAVVDGAGEGVAAVADRPGRRAPGHPGGALLPADRGDAGVRAGPHRWGVLGPGLREPAGSADRPRGPGPARTDNRCQPRPGVHPGPQRQERRPVGARAAPRRAAQTSPLGREYLTLPTPPVRPTGARTRAGADADADTTAPHEGLPADLLTPDHPGFVDPDGPDAGDPGHDDRPAGSGSATTNTAWSARTRTSSGCAAARSAVSCSPHPSTPNRRIPNRQALARARASRAPTTPMASRRPPRAWLGLRYGHLRRLTPTPRATATSSGHGCGPACWPPEPPTAAPEPRG